MPDDFLARGRSHYEHVVKTHDLHDEVQRILIENKSHRKKQNNARYCGL